ncbi:MAG: transposase [Richelia sp.]|nr:transposase [Richelia sp.]CDN16397.1 hypothetical protein RintRC_2189 [Richelia intracellularis]
MPEVRQIIQDYVSAWNSSDSEERVVLMTKVLANNSLYFDSHLPEPILNRESHCQFIDRFRNKFPNITLSLTSAPDSHHGHFRFNWQMLQSNGDVFVKGCFFGEIDDKYKITKLVGFV